MNPLVPIGLLIFGIGAILHGRGNGEKQTQEQVAEEPSSDSSDSGKDTSGSGDDSTRSRDSRTSDEKNDKPSLGLDAEGE